MRRTTRSQTRAAAAAQDTEPKDPLNKLSHDELGVVFDLLARSSLCPFLAVALASTCKGLWTPLRARLVSLQDRYAQKRRLCQYMGMTCAEMREASYLSWYGDDPDEGSGGQTTRAHKTHPRTIDRRISFRWAMGVLGTILVENGMPNLTWLDMGRSGFFNCESAKHIARGLHSGSPIVHLLLDSSAIGDEGASALAAGVRASPSLKMASLLACAIGPEGARALAAALTARIAEKKQPVYLEIGMNPIGFPAVALLREADPKNVSFAQDYPTASERFKNAMVRG